jgi:hypothetical protein
MQSMDRRTMLCAIALGVLFAIRRAPAAGAVRWKIPLARVPAPAGVLSRLPGDGNQLALTVDDGRQAVPPTSAEQFSGIIPERDGCMPESCSGLGEGSAVVMKLASASCSRRRAPGGAELLMGARWIEVSVR